MGRRGGAQRVALLPVPAAQVSALARPHYRQASKYPAADSTASITAFFVRLQLYDYDYSDTHTVAAFFVLLFEMVLFQIFSLVCLRYLNNIKR